MGIDYSSWIFGMSVLVFGIFITGFTVGSLFGYHMGKTEIYEKAAKKNVKKS